VNVTLVRSASIQGYKRNLCINFSKKVTFQRGLCCDFSLNKEFDNPKNNKQSFIHSMTQGFQSLTAEICHQPRHRHPIGELINWANNDDRYQFYGGTVDSNMYQRANFLSGPFFYA
jgi:hypothetical protein